MPTFLILQSPNKGNVGTTTQREEGFYKPTFYQISDSELQEYNAMNAHAKAAFIAEKLEAQIGTPTQDKKKVAPIVEVVERVEESVSVNLSHSHFGENVEVIMADKDAFLSVEKVEMPEIEVEEPLNEPINEVEVVETPKAKEKVKTVAKAVEKPKAKGRPKKTN